MEKFLIWWTNQNDCERITPLDSWPMWLYDEFRSRQGRAGRGRLWVPQLWASEAPDGVKVPWDTGANWICRAADDAGGIVIPANALRHVQFLPGFVSTFDMALPDLDDDYQIMKPYTPETALRRRSTERLKNMLAAARRSECECDSYHGFECGKHRRIDMIEEALAERGIGD